MNKSHIVIKGNQLSYKPIVYGLKCNNVQAHVVIQDNQTCYSLAIGL